MKRIRIRNTAFNTLLFQGGKVEEGRDIGEVHRVQEPSAPHVDIREAANGQIRNN